MPLLLDDFISQNLHKNESLKNQILLLCIFIKYISTTACIALKKDYHP